MTIRSVSRSIPLGQGLWAGLIGGVLAAILNVFALLLGQVLNGSSIEVMRPGTAEPMALPLFAVLLFSLVPGLIAGLLYALLSRYSSRPWRWLLTVSLIGLALMGIAPFGAAQGVVALWTLEFMHLLAAGAILWAIARFARP